MIILCREEGRAYVELSFCFFRKSRVEWLVCDLIHTELSLYGEPFFFFVFRLGYNGVCEEREGTFSVNQDIHVYVKFV